MSGGKACRDSTHRGEWVVTTREAHHSAFHGGRRTPSRWPEIRCRVCSARWRSKGKFVKGLPDEANAPVTAREWNARHPIGTLVRAWLGARGDEPLHTRTRTRAWTLGHGAAVVSVEGCGGGIALTHVEAVDTRGWYLDRESNVVHRAQRWEGHDADGFASVGPIRSAWWVITPTTGPCPDCGGKREVHGDLFGVTVCPGDWIVSNTDVYTDDDFRKSFEETRITESTVFFHERGEGS